MFPLPPGNMPCSRIALYSFNVYVTCIYLSVRNRSAQKDTLRLLSFPLISWFCEINLLTFMLRAAAFVRHCQRCLSEDRCLRLVQGALCRACQSVCELQRVRWHRFKYVRLIQVALNTTCANSNRPRVVAHGFLLSGTGDTQSHVLLHAFHKNVCHIRLKSASNFVRYVK